MKMIKEMNEEQIEQQKDVIKEQNSIDYSTNPCGEKIEEFPDFIEILNDGNYKVIMRQIKNIPNCYPYFIVEDIDGEKMKKLQDRSKKYDGELDTDKLQDLIIQNAILYPQLTIEQINKMKYSQIMRLSKAINMIYDVESFLKR